MAVDDMSLSLLQDAAKKGKLIPFAKMHPSIAMLRRRNRRRWRSPRSRPRSGCSTSAGDKPL